MPLFKRQTDDVELVCSKCTRLRTKPGHVEPGALFETKPDSEPRRRQVSAHAVLYWSMRAERLLTLSEAGATYAYPDALTLWEWLALATLQSVISQMRGEKEAVRNQTNAHLKSDLAQQTLAKGSGNVMAFTTRRSEG